MRNHWPVKNRLRAVPQWKDENFLNIPQLAQRAKYLSDGLISFEVIQYRNCQSFVEYT